MTIHRTDETQVHMIAHIDTRHSKKGAFLASFFVK